MNPQKISLPVLALAISLAISLAIFTGCSKSGDADDSAGTAPVKSESETPAGVTLDAATQMRLGLQLAMPAATQWQPESKAYGVVMDPAVLATAVVELASARVTADASDKEYRRQETLAVQNNSSARALESAQASATHDDLAWTAELARFKADWGSALAENGAEITSQLASNQAALVRIDLPAGENLPATPSSASLVLSAGKINPGDNPFDAVFFDAINGVDLQTQGQSFFFLVKNRTLPPNAAVIGFLKMPGEPVNGVTVPAAAVLRYEGRGWIYTQTGTNQFLREGIPLDYPVENGWFVPDASLATNNIIIVGAQTVLSAELSGGSFNTGERD
jgi:hypothetical protein